MERALLRVFALGLVMAECAQTGRVDGVATIFSAPIIGS